MIEVKLIVGSLLIFAGAIIPDFEGWAARCLRGLYILIGVHLVALQ